MFDELFEEIEEEEEETLDQDENINSPPLYVEKGDLDELKEFMLEYDKSNQNTQEQEQMTNENYDFNSTLEYSIQYVGIGFIATLSVFAIGYLITNLRRLLYKAS